MFTRKIVSGDEKRIQYNPAKRRNLASTLRSRIFRKNPKETVSLRFRWDWKGVPRYGVLQPCEAVYGERYSGEVISLSCAIESVKAPHLVPFERTGNVLEDSSTSRNKILELTWTWRCNNYEGGSIGTWFTRENENFGQVAIYLST